MSDSHPLDQITVTGPHGGPSWRYRGVVIHSNGPGTVLSMEKPPEGLPGRWTGLGNLEQVRRIIDAWLDRRALPAGYRVPCE